MKQSYINEKCPTCGKGRRIPITGDGHLQIHIDRDLFRSKKNLMTGQELLELAGRVPVESFAIYQKRRGDTPLRVKLTDKIFIGDDEHNRLVTLPIGMSGG